MQLKEFFHVSWAKDDPDYDALCKYFKTHIFPSIETTGDFTYILNLPSFYTFADWAHTNNIDLHRQ